MNHMTDSRSAFSELDFEICRSVKFGDGSVINIEGRGTILFIRNGDEHHMLTGVYYIWCLKANIVSLRLLDEAGA
jgi:hypothetical protein